ncbi:putative replication protein [uncultured virus]|uniref:ATP-dependent helicase Rep n=1 Tax=uncultured virus TaxID=340016 RepID=A0A1I9XGD2_9VIRU|nr:putative replication protein [uncultured virus]
MPTTAKHWCWTLNNPTDLERDQLEAIGNELPEPIVYLVYGDEVGESGTPHLQGSGRKELPWVKNAISDRAHLEAAKGTTKQASDYCKKDGNFKEFGTLPKGRGQRTDIAGCVNQIKAGKSLREITELHPEIILRYGSGVLRLRQHYRPTRETPPQIWVFWGPTGTGKTRRVWEFTDPNELWVHPGERWFDGYDGHPAVLFDDFDGSWFKLSYLLKLLDRYVMPVPVKGAQAWWCPKTIYITSNIKPEEWYQGSNQNHRDALMRRLTEFGTIEHCT